MKILRIVITADDTATVILIVLSKFFKSACHYFDYDVSSLLLSLRLPSLL